MRKQTSWVDDNGNLWVKDSEAIETYILMGKIDLNNIGKSKE